MENINNRLGFKNSFDENAIITRKQIEEMGNYLNENRKSILTAFHKKERCKIDEPSFNKNIKLLQYMYYDWSQMSLEVNSKDTHTKTPIDYILKNKDETINIFEYVR